MMCAPRDKSGESMEQRIYDRMNALEGRLRHLENGQSLPQSLASDEGVTAETGAHPMKEALTSMYESVVGKLNQVERRLAEAAGRDMQFQQQLDTLKSLHIASTARRTAASATSNTRIQQLQERLEAEEKMVQRSREPPGAGPICSDNAGGMLSGVPPGAIDNLQTYRPTAQQPTSGWRERPHAGSRRPSMDIALSVTEGLRRQMGSADGLSLQGINEIPLDSWKEGIETRLTKAEQEVLEMRHFQKSLLFTNHLPSPDDIHLVQETAQTGEADAEIKRGQTSPQLSLAKDHWIKQ